MKDVNRYTSNEFHDWQRANLPGAFVIQDVDAWALVVSDAQTYEPLALVELKRSSIDPTRWMPFDADRPNYAALLALATRAGLPLWVVYFQMGKPIQADSTLALFELHQAEPEYHGLRRYMQARDFAESFPYLFPVRNVA